MMSFLSMVFIRCSLPAWYPGGGLGTVARSLRFLVFVFLFQISVPWIAGGIQPDDRRSVGPDHRIFHDRIVVAVDGDSVANAFDDDLVVVDVDGDGFKPNGDLLDVPLPLSGK